MSKIVFTIGLAAIAMRAHAAENKDLTPQQSLIAACNKEAIGRKGDDRKKFMSECLKK